MVTCWRALQRFSAVLIAASGICTFAACGGGGSIAPNVAPSLAPASPIPAGPQNPAFELPAPVLGQSDDWSTYAHDMYRTAFEPAPTGITQHNVSGLRLRWTFKSPGQFLASPIVSNGIVYVVDVLGQLSALRADTGVVLWQKPLGYSVALTPSIYDGILFVGTHDAPVSILSALDPSTGNLVWQQLVQGGLNGSPVSVNGILYVGVGLGDPIACRPGGIYTFNEHTGAPGPYWLTEEDGNQSDGGGIWGPISYDGQEIIYGTGNTCANASDNANAVLAISPDLSKVWAVQTSTPTNDDDVGGGIMVFGTSGYVLGKNGTLYAINLKTGLILWSDNLGAVDGYGGHPTPSYTEGTLIVSGGFPVPPTGDPAQVPTGTLYGLGLDGSVKWKISVSYPPSSTYVATTPDLAFAELDNSIDALDPATGRTLWSYTTTGDFSAGPVITQSGLFVADLSGTLYAFSVSAGNSSRTRLSTGVHAIKGVTKYKPTIPPYCKL